MMLLVVLMLCTCAVISAQVVNYQQYSGSGCAAGNESTTTGWVSNACLTGTSSSNKYTCVNNVPYSNSYTGSGTCSNTPSTYQMPTICVR